MPYDSDNIFAKILRKEASAFVVEETEKTLAFMDVHPLNPGHTLVIPKEPATDIFEMSPDALSAVAIQVKRISRALIETFQSEGIFISQLNRPGAGQSVFHYHVHVIPQSGGLPAKLHSRQMADFDELEQHSQMIRAKLAELS